MGIIMLENVSVIAVLGAAAASMIVGSLWYSPILFGSEWQRLIGFTPDKMAEVKARGMAKIYAANFIMSVVTAYVMALFMSRMSIGVMSGAAKFSGAAWLGFMAPILMGGILWENKPWKFFSSMPVFGLYQ